MLIEDKISFWQDVREKLNDIRSFVEGAIRSDFAPYRKTPDTDAENAQFLFNSLDNICDFIDAHFSSIQEEYITYCCEQYHLQRAFEAWERGLCLKALDGTSNTPDWNYEKPLWDILAGLKSHRHISFEDTKNALRLWRSSCSVAAS